MADTPYSHGVIAPKGLGFSSPHVGEWLALQGKEQAADVAGKLVSHGSASYLALPPNGTSLNSRAEYVRELLARFGRSSFEPVREDFLTELYGYCDGTHSP